MSRDLPARPSLDHLKKQAKDLVRGGAATRLADAQRLVAREYGFPSWTKLKRHVLSLAADPADALAAALNGNDAQAVRRVLKAHPELGGRLNEPLPGADFGALPLHQAVRSRNREIIDLLLALGADINGKSRWWAGGFGLLETADAEVVPFLLERGITMTIHGAARLGRLADVDRLVRDDSAAVHARGGDGQTPLHVASTVEIARALVEHGADVDALDVDHESTPAQYAVRERQDVARFLVSAGCRADILLAAALGDEPRVRALLDADPSSAETSVSADYFPMANPRAGGTIYIWTLGGNKTAHVVAREFGHQRVLELLMRRTRDALRLALACETGDRATFDAILAARPDVAATLTVAEARRLPAAAEANNAGAVRLMLEAGWPVNALAGGASALHWAGFHGNAGMARAILRHSPSLELEDAKFHGRPLGWALHGSLNGWHRDRGDYPATVAALLDAGATMPTTNRLEASEPVRDLLRRRGLLG